MDVSEQYEVEQAPRTPLHALKDVPISVPFIERMTCLLTEHGATLEETKDYPTGNPPYKEYTITFPTGTVRAFGLVMMRSRYFSIFFPDGSRLRGGELWPLECREGDTSMTVLHLPVA